MEKSVFDRVITAFGNQRRFAEAMGVTPQSVTKWKRQIPADRVLEVERLTNISRHEIRPDIFGPVPDSSAA